MTKAPTPTEKSKKQRDKKKNNNNNKTKRPKGPHNMHLSTMCYLFDGSARVTIFVYWSAKKTANLVEDVEILLPVNFR